MAAAAAESYHVVCDGFPRRHFYSALHGQQQSPPPHSWGVFPFSSSPGPASPGPAVSSPYSSSPGPTSLADSALITSSSQVTSVLRGHRVYQRSLRDEERLTLHCANLWSRDVTKSTQVTHIERTSLGQPRSLGSAGGRGRGPQGSLELRQFSIGHSTEGRSPRVIRH